VLAVGQNQETAIVDHQAQPPCPLTWRPPNLMLAGFGMRSRSAEHDQGHPLPVDFADITQAWPSDTGTVEIMLSFQQRVETLALIFPQQADAQFAEILSFGNQFWLAHAAGLPKTQPLVYSFLENLFGTSRFAASDEMTPVINQGHFVWFAHIGPSAFTRFAFRALSPGPTRRKEVSRRQIPCLSAVDAR
jgi:hypothetical protein